MKNIAGKIFRKESLIVLLVLLQVFLLAAVIFIGAKAPFARAIYCLVTLICVFYIVNSGINPAYKLAWSVTMLLFPVYGGFLWLLMGKKHTENTIFRQMQPYFSETARLMPPTEKTEGNAAEYLKRQGFPACAAEDCRYFSMGEELFSAMLERARTAKKSIYIEFFIISEGRAWDMLLEILAEKAAAGVDVRIVIDGAGSLYTKPAGFIGKLKKLGIDCREFNPVLPRISGRINFRDHRKLFIVDEKYAFCGGINVSDEYMNYKERFGVWKDTGFEVGGAAARSFTLMFLGMWGYLSGKNQIPPLSELPQKREKGTVLPFSDAPLDNRAVSLRVYLSLIAEAKETVFITTPYLICDEEMLGALCFAARLGRDVRIITPHIPDKKSVNMITKSNYPRLIEAGVRIFEYRPGFIHAKNLVIDGKTAVVGTVNLDYRSFYLLFECACIFYGGNVPKAAERDFLDTQQRSIEITREDCRRISPLVKIVRGLLKLYAPLM